MSITNSPSWCFPRGAGARNCKELLEQGQGLSGWYPVHPQPGRTLTVFCDMETDGGGWLVSPSTDGGKQAREERTLEEIHHCTEWVCGPSSGQSTCQAEDSAAGPG